MSPVVVAAGAAAVTVAAPLTAVLWLKATELILRRVPPGGARRLRPWLWLVPTLAIAGTYLLWPAVRTVMLSVSGDPGGGTRWENFRYLFTAAEVRSAMINNAWWLVGLTGVTLVLGLLIAILADKVAWEALAKTVIVMPVAISTVAGAVIWKLMFDYRPPGLPQTGTLNALTTNVARRDPTAWLIEQPLNKVALLAVGVWMSTGIATVIISAALKALPPELAEAARIDGAGSWRVVRYIVLPQLAPTLVTVGTLLAITALKAFDVVYVMTNGNYDTNVLANLMYRELFLGDDQGHAAALALLIMVLTAPVIAANVWNFRTQETR